MNNTQTDTAIKEVLPEHLRINAGATKETRGEKAAHWFAHKFWNTFVNYLLSVSITDLSLGSKEGEKKPGSYIVQLANKAGIGENIGKFSDWFKRFHDVTLEENTFNALKTAGVSDAVAKQGGGIVADVFTLMLGGHFTTVAATYIQNRMDKYARKFDNMYDSFGGHKPSETEKAEREARYEHLKSEPKITFGKAALGRFIGFIANFITSTGTAWAHEKMMSPERIALAAKNKAEGNEEQLGARALTTYLGKNAVTPVFNNVASAFVDPNTITNPTEGRKKRIAYWSEMALFEAVCTFNTSTAHWLVTEVFGKKKKEESATPVANNNSSNKPAETAKPDEKVVGNAKSDVSDANPEAAPKRHWANNKVAAQEEVKPVEQRREAAAGAAHSFA